MEKVKIRIIRRESSRDLSLPSYATEGSSGMDLYAAIEDEVLIQPGTWEVIPTGIYVEIPEGYEGQVRPRSGLAKDYGVTVLNSPGTIDSDYRGEIKVILINLGKEPFRVKRGDRIAQLVIVPIVRAVFEEVEELSNTERGEEGFGSTGI